MEEDKIFIPHELKSIEVDVEKKIFKVNGEDFGDRCSEFSISCSSTNGWQICMEVDASIIYKNFSRTGTLTGESKHRKPY